MGNVELKTGEETGETFPIGDVVYAWLVPTSGHYAIVLDTKAVAGGWEYLLATAHMKERKDALWYPSKNLQALPITISETGDLEDERMIESRELATIRENLNTWKHQALAKEARDAQKPRMIPSTASGAEVLQTLQKIWTVVEKGEKGEKPKEVPGEGEKLRFTLAAFDELTDRCREVLAERGGQYNQGRLDTYDYFLHDREESFNQMLHVKVLREFAQEGKPFKGRDMDSLLDLINYTLFKWWWVLDKEKKEEGNDTPR